MYYSLCFYPRSQIGPVQAIREKYDPTAELIPPHVAVVFPVPESVGKAELERHVSTTLLAVAPFTMRFGGFDRSPDHWLFLTLVQGAARIKELYRELYTGILSDYGRDPERFVPHASLGLFVKDLAAYDWNDPKPSEFDTEVYEEAMAAARELRFDESEEVKSLTMVGIPDEVLDWARGQRREFPDEARAVTLGEFELGALSDRHFEGAP